MDGPQTYQPQSSEQSPSTSHQQGSTPSDYSQLFNPQVDHSQLFISPPPKGTGSDSADRYISSMLSFGSIDDITGVKVGDLLQTDLNTVKSFDTSQIKPFVDSNVTNVTQSVVSKQIDTLSRLYASNGDPALLNQAKQEVDQAKKIKDLPLANELATMALAKLQGKGLNDVDKITIARHANLAQIAEYMDYAHVGLTDYLGALIPFRNTYQFETNGGYNKYIKSIQNFRALMPEDQVKAFPKILQDLWKMSGQNPLFFQDRALSYLNIDDIRKVQQSFAFDAVDAATILPFAKVARLIRASSTPLKFARDAGRADIAGRIIADTLEDTSGKTADAVGTDRISAAASALPFGGEGLIPEITDNVAGHAAGVISERLSKQNEFIDKALYDGNSMIQRSPLNQREIDAAQKKWVDNQAGKVTITKSTPTGFEADVEIVNPSYRKADPADLMLKVKDRETQISDIQSRMADLRNTYGKSVHEGDSLQAKEYLGLQERMYDLNQEIKKLNDTWDRNVEQDPTKIVRKKVIYTYNDVGELESTEYSKASSKVNSADIYINQMESGLVQQADSINFTQNQMKTFLQRGFVEATKGLSKKSRGAVSDILLQGDADKIGRYSTLDLYQGIVTKNGLKRLTTAEEIAAYHGARNTLDAAYILKNRQLRRELEFEGWKAVKTPDADGADVVSFVKPESALKELPDNVKKIYDLEVGRPVEILDKTKINARIADEGWMLMKAKYPIEHGDELLEYVLAKNNHVKPLPRQVLAYRPGYVPKIYKNIFFIVERVGPKIINGVKHENARSVARYFDSGYEAERWAKLNSNAETKYHVSPGREWLDSNPNYKDDYEAAVFGGLYSGKRNADVIPFGFEGQEAEHIGAFQAIEKAINHVSTRVPINEFRMGMIRRFINSARDPVTRESYLSNPGDWRSALRTDKLSPVSDTYHGLEAMRSWMEDQFRIPSSNERQWHNFATRLAGYLDGSLTNSTPLKAVRLGLMNLAQKNIFGAMRAAAFHSLLGWFNPAQLYVQALGASMAFSINPALAGKIIPQYMALRAATFLSAPGAWRRTGIAAGLLGEDFEHLVRDFLKTGIRDSVKSTADYDAAVHGYGIAAGSLRRAADAGLIFFREGEMFVRSYGWLMARHEFLRLKPRGYRLTDIDLDAVTKRSLALTLDLNRANRAYWQKGVLSIPTQFLQITSKFIESMAYSVKGGVGKWTASEKLRIMAGQAVLFGAAGVPFSKWAISNLSEWLKSDGDYGLGIKNPDTIRAINGGLLETMLYKWTGEDLSIASRVSIPQGIESFVDMLLDSDRTVAEKVTGAFGEIPHRVYQTVHDLGPILEGYSAKDAFDLNFFPEAMSKIGEVVSSWRNIHKAMLWEKSKAILDSKGNMIIPIDPQQDGALLLAQKLGLSPKILENYYDLVKFNSLSKRDIDDSAKAWVEIARDYVNSPLMATERGQLRVKAMISHILGPLTEEQRAAVAKKVKAALDANDYKLLKQLVEARDNLMMNHGDTAKGPIWSQKGNAELNPLLTGQPPTQGGYTTPPTNIQ